MTNLFKKITFTALALILLGGILFTVAFALSGFSFKKLSGVKETYSTFHEDVALATSKLYLKFESSDIYVTFDEQAEKISVTYPETTSKNNKKLSTVTCSQADNTISIIETKSIKSNLFIWNFASRKAEVTIPKGRVLDIVIQTNTGDVEIKGNATLTSLSIETDTGDIDIERAALNIQGNAKFETDTGDIELYKFNSENLNIETDTGEITLSGCTVTNNIKIDADTGDIELSDIIKCEKLEIETDTGDIDADEATVDSKNILLETDTGDVEINLAGQKSEYEIQIKITTGRSNVQNQSGSPRKIFVKSSTGDAKIFFKN